MFLYCRDSRFQQHIPAIAVIPQIGEKVMQSGGEDMLGERQTPFCIQDNSCLSQMDCPSSVRICDLKGTGKVAIII